MKYWIGGIVMKINLKGITKESVIGVIVLLVALINAVLQMFGLNTLPITNDDVSGIISTLFLIGSTAYSVYKNFNVTPASQTAQKVTDMIKNGEIAVDQVMDVIEKIKEQNTNTEETEDPETSTTEE